MPLTSRVAGQPGCSSLISPTAASPGVRPAPTHSSEPAGQDDQTHIKPQWSSHLLCAYLNQLWQKDLQVSIWDLLKEVNRCPPHSWIGKAERDEGPVDLAMSGANVWKTNTQTQE